MNTLSFMSANFVARESQYQAFGDLTQWWGSCDEKTNNTFSPIETFAEHFEKLLTDISQLGFSAIDIWNAHLNPQWASESHISIACELLKKHSMVVPSVTASFGNKEAFLLTCKLASKLNVKILAGTSINYVLENAKEATSILRDYNLVCAYENHPDKTPEDVLSKIKNIPSNVIGVALDTGWFGTRGYNAAKAIEELNERITCVHIKDIKKVGEHETCELGKGVVPVRECVQALKKLHYTGPISIEHEPGDYDPSGECKVGLELLKEWLK